MDPGNLRVAPLKGGKVQDGAGKRQNSESTHPFQKRKGRHSGALKN